MFYLVFILAAVIFVSFVEYCSHRWIMHNRSLSRTIFEQHSILHHGRYYKNFSGETDIVAKHVGVELSPFFTFGVMLPVCGILLYFNLVCGIILGVMAFLYGWLWTHVHLEMHEPKNKWFSRTWYFKYIREYHRKHHKYPYKNFNTLLPLGFDYIFRTQV